MKSDLGWILGFLLILGSCYPTFHETSKEIRIAKTLPNQIKLIQDSNLKFHQDTLYDCSKPYSGHLIMLNSKKDTLILKGFFNGLEEGYQKSWYPNKKPKEVRYYINGKKEGWQQGYWPDGKPRFQFRMVNDLYEGEFKEWNSSGFLYKDFHYIHGKEEGSEKLWWDNGIIRANYVMENGKRYGLLGTKICKNPYDSVNKK